MALMGLYVVWQSPLMEMVQIDLDSDDLMEQVESLDLSPEELEAVMREIEEMKDGDV